MPRHKEDIREDAKHAVKDEIESIAETAGRYARKAVEEGRHLAEGGEGIVTAIREEPIKASLIALGVGVVLGALLRSK
ncbi:MAG: hypothetical protein P4M15_07360 [Alphaproteobacteria bacterium]|nr:hypothetical protein [Alphaproteobacteria bacterium]